MLLPTLQSRYLERGDLNLPFGVWGMVVDLGEERIAGCDGLEIPGVGVVRAVSGQAVGAPVASAEDGVGSHLELVAELAAPPQGGEEIARGHGLREAFSAAESGGSPHILDIQFRKRLGLVVAVVQDDSVLGAVGRTAQVHFLP